MIEPTNPPGLSAIAYRIATFSTFRAAMLADVARTDLLAPFPDSTGANGGNPFVGWQSGTAGDYHTLFIELWAYLADILTFYQERIANEAYLPTATSRDSLVRLAQLVGYAAAPGSAARTVLAFTLGPQQTVSIPAGTRVASKAAGAAPPVTFETANAITATSRWNAIALSPVAVANQFAPLASFQTIFVTTIENLPTLDRIRRSFEDIYGPYDAYVVPALYASLYARLSTVSPTQTTQETVETRSVVLAGIGLRLNAGDMVLVCEQVGTTNEKASPYALTGVTIDRTAGTTTISWTEPAGTTYADSPADPVAVFALRVRARFFGATAPLWTTLAPTLNNSDGFHPNAPYAATNWDDPANYAAQLPFDPFNQTRNLYAGPSYDSLDLYLDARYPALRASSAWPDRGYLIDARAPSNAQPVALVDAQDVSVTGFAQAATVTRVRLANPLTSTLTFAVRTTTLYAGAERLTRYDLLPFPDPVAGGTLLLAGLFSDLSNGQSVVVQGQGYDLTANAPNGQLQSEVATISGAPVIDTAHGLTLVSLAGPLANIYARATTVLLANVVVATNGRTVRGEMLGTGDSTADQRYPLSKTPLTYLPASGADTSASVSSTLGVTVNGIAWNESPNIDLAGPADTVFEIDRPPDGSAAVVFGDGVHGARPASGAVVKATYRQGLGTSGNVAAGAISNLAIKPAGVFAVSNPLPAAGGVDAEPSAALRVDAPSQVRTFGRAVAVEDIAALALTYPGIAKTAAAWQTRNTAGRASAHPYVQLIVAAADLLPLAQHAPPLRPLLRAFLDGRRDPNVTLQIVDAVAVPIVVCATLDIVASFGRTATLAAAQAALGGTPSTPGFFSLWERQFGETIALSSIYALLQGVPGVRDVVITAFPLADGPVLNAVALRSTQFATLDPSSTLTLASGGYVDA